MQKILLIDFAVLFMNFSTIRGDSTTPRVQFTVEKLNLLVYTRIMIILLVAYFLVCLSLGHEAAIPYL